MELMFVILIALALGLAARYLIPGRDTYGVVLVPSIGAVVTSVVWIALLWSGFKFDGGWIWVVSLLVGVLAASILASTLPRSRRSHDADLLHRLSRA